MASLFEAYITNLGKYNEGELVGETLKFPTTTEAACCASENGNNSRFLSAFSIFVFKI